MSSSSSIGASTPAKNGKGQKRSAFEVSAGAGPALPAAPATRDRSADVPIRQLTKEEWDTTSLRSYAADVNEALLYTGLAKVSINNVPGVSHVQCRSTRGTDEAAVELLARAHPGKLATYRYKLEPIEGQEGAYKIRYKKQGDGYKPTKWYEYAKDMSATGHFAGLPTSGNFADSTYWERIESAAEEGVTVEYPADIHASVLGTLPAFPAGWSLAALSEDNDLLRAIMPWLPFKDNNIPGYTDPMLYVGAAGSSFLLHSEDQNLYSANYLVSGAPKVWYGIPPSYYKNVVELVRRVFAADRLVQSCPQAVMHKQFLLRPDVLRAAGIPVARVVQKAGDMVITAPGAFHFGYNTGFNVAEATNFANAEWWTGRHYHDALAVGACKCKEAPRFHFKESDVREGLEEAGEPFGVTKADL